MEEESLPRSGHVSQLRQNWTVFEDESIAVQLQNTEINQHYRGNRSRNQQIRSDHPQAKYEQEKETEEAERQKLEYLSKLNKQSQEDSRIAKELALTQGIVKQPDPEYIAQRDAQFARNLQKMEQRYHASQQHPQQPNFSTNGRISQDPFTHSTSSHSGRIQEDPANLQQDVSFHDIKGGLQYHEEQYQHKLARPAMITDEPLYANNANHQGSSSRHFVPPGGPGTGAPQQSANHPNHANQAFEKHTDTVFANHDRNQATAYDRNNVFALLDKDTAPNVSLSTDDGEERYTSTSTSSRSRSSMASNGYSEIGACGGAAALPVENPEYPNDILGIRGALSESELRQARKAEELREQEQKDAEMARKLQEQLSLSEDDPSNADRMLAIEAQDREFAKILQAKEKAKAKRARERAKQRKLEKQRLEDPSEGLDTVVTVEQRPSRDGRSSKSENRPLSATSGDGRLSRGDGRVSRGQEDARMSLSPGCDPHLPSRKPYVHPEAIDNHKNDTYCKTPPKEVNEPQYANLDETGKPMMTEPILHLPLGQIGEGGAILHSPRQASVLDEMAAPPYMPMVSSASRKSENLEKRIKKKKEKEGCKQQ